MKIINRKEGVQFTLGLFGCLIFCIFIGICVGIVIGVPVIIMKWILG